MSEKNLGQYIGFPVTNYIHDPYVRQAIRNLFNGELIWADITGNIEDNQTLVDYIAAHGGSGLPTTIAFSTQLKFDAQYGMDGIDQTGTIAFTINTTGAANGGGGTVRIVSNGDAITVPAQLKKYDNSPTFDDIVADGQAITLCWERVSGIHYYWLLKGEMVDNTPPTFISAGTTDTTHIATVFSEAVSLSNATGFSLSNGSAVTISSVADTGTSTLIFALGSALVNGQTLTLSYNSGIGNVTDLAGNPLASFTNQTVVNNIPSVGVNNIIFNQVTGVTESPTGKWNPSTLDEAFGHTGLSTGQTIAANVDGRIYMTYVNGPVSGGAGLGFNTASAEVANTAMPVALQFTFFGDLYYLDAGGSYAQLASYSGVEGTLYGFARIGGVTYLQTSNNGGTSWTNLHTMSAFSASGNANVKLYPVIDINGHSDYSVTNPKLELL